MMGPMTLAEMRAKLEEALRKQTDDPIQWLEQRIRERKQDPKEKPGSTVVLEALLSVLKRGKPKKPRKRRAAHSKS